MRIGFVCPYDLGRHGGVQDQIALLSRTLRNRGHDTVLVGPGASGPPDAVLVGSVTEVPGNGSTTPLALSPRSVGRAVDALRDVDVIHVHEPLMPMVSLGTLLRRPHPIVGTFHADPSRLIRTGYRLAGPLLRRLFDRMAVVTAVSPVAAGAVEHLVDVRIVPNMVDLSAGGNSTQRNDVRVAFLGRNDPRKGLSVLLDAWPAVKASVPQAELIVIGSDPVHGAPTDVVFHGRVSEERKRDLLAASGVFCAPNTGGESFGVVVVEGMAAGAAVVASALPGFEFVLAGAGVTVPPKDPAALAGALSDVLSDGELRTRLQAAGPPRAAQFDVNLVVSGYEAVYTEAAGS